MAPGSTSPITSYAVLLAGDAVGLGHAEVAALEAVDGVSAVAPHSDARIRWTPSEYAAKTAVQGLCWGTHWASAEATPEGIASLAEIAKDRTSGTGSIAVRVTRFAGASKSLTPQVAQTVGAALADAGHAIDLKQPEHQVYAWIGDDFVHMGLLGGVRDTGHEQRIMERRKHFSPIGMHPRRAASLVHLARVPPGGRILDPFCGTGGIVLEAAGEAYDAWGSDLDNWMVQGTMQALADAADAPLEATIFEADIGQVPELVEGIQGIATDMPYGKASTTDREALASLYDRALASFAAILPPGGLAVVGHMDPALLSTAPDHGLEVAAWGNPPQPDSHEEYVHGSMTRHYTVLRRR